MSKIKNGGLEDQHGAKAFEQQQFGTTGVEWVKRKLKTFVFINAYDFYLFYLTL